jgi:peptidoglycan hydrolase-like protein with peptidoglycan-binding domain
MSCGSASASTPVTTTTPTTQTTYFYFTLPLKYGSKGIEVTELQKRLISEGYLSATANGTFGPATESAVKAFQKAHGLEQLGSVGPGTRAALNK